VKTLAYRLIALVLLAPVLIISLAILAAMEAIGKWLVGSAQMVVAIWRAMA
jgi:hypothetical protein